MKARATLRPLLVALVLAGACGKDKTTALDIELEVSGAIDQVEVVSVSLAGMAVSLDGEEHFFPMTPTRMLKSGDVLTIWFADTADGKTIVVTATGRLCGKTATPLATTAPAMAKLAKGQTTRVTLALANDGTTTCVDGGAAGTGGAAGSTGGRGGAGAAGTGGASGSGVAGAGGVTTGAGGGAGSGAGGVTAGAAGTSGAGGAAGSAAGAAGRGGAGGVVGAGGVTGGVAGSSGRGGTGGGAAGRGGTTGTAGTGGGAAGRGGTTGTAGSGGAAGRGGTTGTAGTGGGPPACATNPVAAAALPAMAAQPSPTTCGYPLTGASAQYIWTPQPSPGADFAFGNAAVYGNSANCGRCVDLVYMTRRRTVTLVGACSEPVCMANPNAPTFALSQTAYSALATMNEPMLPSSGALLTYSFVPCPVPIDANNLPASMLATLTNSGANSGVAFFAQRYGILSASYTDPTTATTIGMSLGNNNIWRPLNGQSFPPQIVTFNLTDVNQKITSFTMQAGQGAFASANAQMPTCIVTP